MTGVVMQHQQLNCDALERLDQDTFAGLACADHGLVVLRGADSWGAHERGFIEIPDACGVRRIALSYDERGGPYALGAHGEEQPDLLVSLTDEKGLIACCWAHVPASSPIVGLGVDLCEVARFRDRPHAKHRDIAELLLTPQERELVCAISEEHPLYAKAVLFAAKEAAFKATAAPLRRWYDAHDEQFLYGVRHFVMEELGLERGTWRNGAAQAAMDAMGIDHIQVRWALVEDMALVTAVAVRA